MNFLNIVIELSLVDIHLKFMFQTLELTYDKVFFCVRVVNIWNSLPDNIASATNSVLFSRVLHDVNLKQHLLGKNLFESLIVLFNFFMCIVYVFVFNFLNWHNRIHC